MFIILYPEIILWRIRIPDAENIDEILELKSFYVYKRIFYIILQKINLKLNQNFQEKLSL